MIYTKGNEISYHWFFFTDRYKSSWKFKYTDYIQGVALEDVKVVAPDPCYKLENTDPSLNLDESIVYIAIEKLQACLRFPFLKLF